MSQSAFQAGCRLTICRQERQKSAAANRILSPKNTTVAQSTMMPTVTGAAIIQKCRVVLVVPDIPTTFIPKNPATKLNGRNKTVIKVKMKIALLLSSCRVSTRCTSWTARTLALSRSSVQFLNCSRIEVKILSMPFFSNSNLSLRAVLGLLKLEGSKYPRKACSTFSCCTNMSFTIATSSSNAFMSCSRRRLARRFTLSALFSWLIPGLAPKG